MKLTSTKTSLKYINCLVYGRTGMGKTPLGATAPRPIILDTEKGTMSISDLDLPMLEIRNIDDLNDAYDYVNSKKGKDFDTVVIDSGSELAEIVLSSLKEDVKDKRQAYMELNDAFLKVLRKFKDLDKHLVVTAKMRISSVDGSEKYRPSFPGNALPESIPYLFDEVFVLRLSKDDDKEEDDDNFKFLQTQPDEDYDAKDRSTKLKGKEKPDLSAIFEKILSGGQTKKKKKKKKNQE